MNLYEKYRPSSLEDFIGNDKAIQKVKKLMQRGVGGRAYWITGASGTGKTTLALILGKSIASDWNIKEIDSTGLFPAHIKEIEDTIRYHGMEIETGKGGHCIIINEAHGLRRDTIRQLLVTLERIPSHCIFCFTTTKLGEKDLFEDQIDASPLLSRCVEISLTNQGLAPLFASRAQVIAVSEGLDGQSPEEYLKLARRCSNNMRMMLQEIDSGAMMA